MLSNINISKLHDELEAAGIMDPHIDKSENKIFNPMGEEIQDNVDVQAVLSNHDPVDYVHKRRIGSEINAENIPGWATWTEAEALGWVDNNVIDLASAKTAIKALTRMVLALRDKNFPNLRGQQSDD